ncbi:hypothetical protein [Microcystis aeruginosa]|nr:hypothetical protein [Microcystis aeruginosa]
MNNPASVPTRTPSGVGKLHRGNEEFHPLRVSDELPVTLLVLVVA